MPLPQKWSHWPAWRCTAAPPAAGRSARHRWCPRWPQCSWSLCPNGTFHLKVLLPADREVTPAPQRRKLPPVTSVSLLTLVLLTAADHDEGCHAQQGHAANGEHPHAVATGLGQIKSGVVNHGQGDDGIAIGHGDVLAIDRSAGGQQLGTALLAGTIFLGGNDDLDRFLQQHIPLIRGGFSQAVAIILQPFHDDVAAAVGNKGGCISLLRGNALGVVF